MENNDRSGTFALHHRPAADRLTFPSRSLSLPSGAICLGEVNPHSLSAIIIIAIVAAALTIDIPTTPPPTAVKSITIRLPQGCRLRIIMQHGRNLWNHWYAPPGLPLS